MNTILAPVDLSELTPRVAAQAASLSRAFGAQLWLIHVAAPDPDFVGFRTGPQYVRDHRAEILKQEHRDLHDLRDLLRAEGVNAEALLVQGPTTETILQEAADLNADLIVMGSHGRSGLFKALVGSVCEQVLRESNVPVHIVPAKESGDRRG
ncbi:MAG: universal stress protein [Flavobacteriales bacterium]|nr:universal stress protein [Flavobacteriales bacterium]MCB0784941.1 universal stress protein [Flavobacteriales bacterium]MCB0788222.1 universal stress protein [Flavobacteriales bacterium]MCB0817365.1 universal stress protein [Flavobacteriales bacterium]HOP42728.1 universal stress protein [Flavobacteriales bacterium]